MTIKTFKIFLLVIFACFVAKLSVAAPFENVTKERTILKETPQNAHHLVQNVTISFFEENEDSSQEDSENLGPLFIYSNTYFFDFFELINKSNKANFQKLPFLGYYNPLFIQFRNLRL